MWLKSDPNGVRLKISNDDLSEVNLSDVNLSRANLSGTDLSYANLSGTDLSDADLSDTDLIGANLSYANLSGANLSRANLSGVPLFVCKLKNHYISAYGRQIRIGCKTGDLDWFLANYIQLGEIEGYSDDDIREYGIVLKMINELFPKETDGVSN